jgi:hypothetical protein
VVDPHGEGNVPSEPNEWLWELYVSTDGNLELTPIESTPDNPPQTGNRGSTQTSHYKLTERRVSSNEEK